LAYNAGAWRPTREASYEVTPAGGYTRAASFRVKPDRSDLEFGQLTPMVQGAETLYVHAFSFLTASTFRFKAERVIPARCGIGNPRVLAPDGSNLGATLLYLQGNRKPYADLMSHVRSIFPNVEHVSVIPVSASECEIRVWTFDPDSGREDLTTSLDESGTGVAQVLAILFVVVASSEAKIIMIDEPNSYLHPGRREL
jgi:predicted ATPase